MGDRTYYNMSIPASALTEVQAEALAKQMDFAYDGVFEAQCHEFHAEDAAVGYCQEFLTQAAGIVLTAAEPFSGSITVTEDGSYNEEGWTGTWSPLHGYHFVASTDSGPIVARHAVEQWWAEAANPLEFVGKLKEYFGPTSKLDPKYDPCPECKAPLRKWREANHHDPGDVEPRAACTNPDCSFEY